MRTRRPRVALRATSGRMRAAAPAQRRAISLLTRSSRAQSSVSSRTCCSSARRCRLSPERGEVEHLPLAQLRVGEPGQVGDGELARVRAEQDVDAVHVQDLERGASHRREHGLGVERLADALVEGGERAGLLVVEPLGLEVPRALDGEAELAAHRLEEAQLRVVERRAGRAATLRTPAARPVEGERHAGVGHRLVEARGDHRHARAVDGVAGLQPVARGEDLPAEALAEAPRPRRLEVGGRDARGGRRGAASRPSRPRGRPRRSSRPRPVKTGVEGGVEDDLDVLLAVEARRDVGEYGELALAVLHGPLQTCAGARSRSPSNDPAASLAPPPFILTQGADGVGVGLADVRSERIARTGAQGLRAGTRCARCAVERDLRGERRRDVRSSQCVGVWGARAAHGAARR